jgi:hypothetical protein
MSPDLNPIEHLWDNLGRSIRQNYGQFHTLVQLEQALLHEWEMIPQDEIVVLITSMPRRLELSFKLEDEILDIEAFSFAVFLIFLSLVF